MNLGRAVWKVISRASYWLGVTGCMLVGIPAQWLEIETKAGARRCSPPPGHPERLVPDQEPSQTERDLWSQLDEFMSWPP